MYLNKEKVLCNVKKIYRNVRVDNDDDRSSETVSLTIPSDHSPAGSLGTEEKGDEARLVLPGSLDLEVGPLCSPCLQMNTDKPGSSEESGWQGGG